MSGSGSGFGGHGSRFVFELVFFYFGMDVRGGEVGGEGGGRGEGGGEGRGVKGKRALKGRGSGRREGGGLGRREMER